MTAQTTSDALKPVASVDDFDRQSGNRLERFVFNNRLLVVATWLLITAFLGFHALKLPVSASFDDMIPHSHPYIQRYFEHRDALRGMGNSVRIAVENTSGDIFDRDYLLTLQKINDVVYLLPGVDRGYMRGLWTPNLRWTEVTEEGYRGGPVMPDRWDGGPASMERLRVNVARAGILGSFVANDLKSSLISVPLLDKDPETGMPLDDAKFGRMLEAKVRPLQTDTVRIHIIGFAKLVGDLTEGLIEVLKFFAASAAVATTMIFVYTRDTRSTLLVVTTAAAAVVWLLGLMRIVGYDLNPYSILVPFLMFAIALSHGAQRMNGVLQDIGRGTHKYVAARYTFRRLFVAGVTALLDDVAGFAVLIVIAIPVIRDMAVITSLGCLVLIFTMLFFLPVALSYVGVSPRAATRALRRVPGPFEIWVREALASLTEPRRARITVTLAVLLGIIGAVVGLYAQVGDIEPGAPELRQDSRYNRDSAFITDHYGQSADQFVVMLQTPRGECSRYESLVDLDRLGASLLQTAGVRSTFSTADGVRRATSGLYEGDPRWLTIPRNDSNRSLAFSIFQTDRPDMVDRACAVTPLVAYLTDHRAETLTGVVEAVERFAALHDTPARQFQLAAGNAGIEAATNIVVEQANYLMLLLEYLAVLVLTYVTFRSFPAVFVALVPLLITSFLGQALMVVLGMGLKVATLPVIALGVGVGLDYALYLLSVQLTLQRRGVPLREAYLESLDFTGRVVALIGFTMAAAVITWAWSPIKFQADMGILLTFLFLLNMIGALVLIPALSYYLLPSAPGPFPAPGEDWSCP